MISAIITKIISTIIKIWKSELRLGPPLLHHAPMTSTVAFRWPLSLDHREIPLGLLSTDPNSLPVKHVTILNFEAENKTHYHFANLTTRDRGNRVSRRRELNELVHSHVPVTKLREPSNSCYVMAGSEPRCPNTSGSFNFTSICLKTAKRALLPICWAAKPQRLGNLTQNDQKDLLSEPP